MKHFKFFSVLFLTLVAFLNSNAQCTFSGTATTTESRCKESGTITVNMAPSGAYTYQITSGPVTTGPSSSSNVFTGLPKGNYVVTVTLGGCSVTINSTVAGTYVEPSLLTGTVKNIACPSGSGCITANQPIDGRTPYNYALIAGPVTRPLQSNRDFCGLPAGAYTLQALDSCGVVRTTNYTVAYDTGRIDIVVYGYDLRYATCNDLIVCPATGFSGTSSHSLIKVWYVKPNGDTLKVNSLESPVRCDTLVGEAKTYGTWKALAYDSCGRVATTTFTHSAPSLALDYFGSTCTGYRLRIANMWKYNLNVGYRILKCSDNSVVATSNQAPQTTFFSQYFDLDNNTCYKFEHWNECGDTVRTTYTTPARPVFDLTACQSTACNENGKGAILIASVYGSATAPVTFKIIDGPEQIGLTTVQGAFSSYVYLRDLALGTYKVEGTDGCGQKDTIVVTLNKPLQRTVEVTQIPSCSGGANVHVKITSNYFSCAYAANSPYQLIHLNVTNPYYIPVNVTTVLPTTTTPGIYECDLVNVTAGNLLLRTFANADGCTWDTTIIINPYVAPVLYNVTGYLCVSTGVGTVNYTLTGGKPNYQFRIKPQGTSTWGAWQSGNAFTGVTAGVYDINVEDACPNGSITSFSFNPWNKSGISTSTTCPITSQPFTLTANPNINGVNYEWVYNDNVVGTGATYTIPVYNVTNNGVYKLRQTFPGGTCVDSAIRPILDCGTLPIKFDKLSGSFVNGKPKLTWNTLQEDNAITFEIERSTNSVSFEKVASTNSRNISTGTIYTWVDDNSTAVNFYRIKIIESTGKISYSNIIKLAKADDSKADNITISPVPFTTWLNIQIKSTANTNYIINIFDAAGKKMITKNVVVTTGSNTIWMDKELVNLAKGVYIVELYSNNTKTTKKVIKQ